MTSRYLFGPEHGYLECFTSVTQYAGFDGDLVTAILTFDRQVTAARWGYGGMNGQTVVDYYRRFRDRPQGPRVYDATDLPEAMYRGDAEAHVTECGNLPCSWSLRLRWLEAGQPLPDDERRKPHDPVLDSQYVYDDRDRLDHWETKTAALAEHRFVAVVTLSLSCAYDVEE